MTRYVGVFALLLAACGDDPVPVSAPPPPPVPPAEPTPDPTAAVPVDADMACARVIVVAWQGAEHAAATVTRTEDEARARAEELLARIESGGERLDAVAREASDAASSGPRGGLLGTYARSDWPAAHEAIAARVFGMRNGEVSEVMRAPYGWVIAERCPIELLHTRHVLIRFAGARNAPEDLTRTEAEARMMIDAVRALLLGGADFEALARERSEDGSAERGGDMGTLGRGRMTEPYELAAFALAPNEISTVVQSEFGFHVIQRLP